MAVLVQETVPERKSERPDTDYEVTLTPSWPTQKGALTIPQVSPKINQVLTITTIKH